MVWAGDVERTVAHGRVLLFLNWRGVGVEKERKFGNGRQSHFLLLKQNIHTMSRRTLSTLVPAFRASQSTIRASPIVARAFSSSPRALSGGHEAESFESFTERYTAFFQSVEDLFELQRGLNNCFAYDLVPAPGVIEAALRAARRVDDYSTAVRIFEGIKEKVENKSQYEAYIKELQTVKQELGVYLVPYRTRYPAIFDNQSFRLRNRDEGRALRVIDGGYSPIMHRK